LSSFAVHAWHESLPPFM